MVNLDLSFEIARYFVRFFGFLIFIIFALDFVLRILRFLRLFIEWKLVRDWLETFSSFMMFLLKMLTEGLLPLSLVWNVISKED